MANSDKNIRITTSKNKTTYPNIVFTGSAAGSSVITLEVLDDNTLSFTSNEGQVFSIDSNLSSGTIWAVSDISGIPLLSSSAGGTVGIAVYGGIVGIGQTNPAYKLDLKGSFGLASANDGLYNFIFSNSAASGSNSLQIRSANSILLYNSGNTFYTGFKSNAAANVTYTLPTTDGSSGQFLQTNGTGTLSWATATGGAGGGSTGVGAGGQYEVAYYPGTGSSVIGNSNLKNNTATSVVSVSYTTAAVDFNTGAFTVSGGVGIGGSLFVGGIGASISGVSFSNSVINRGTWNGTAIATQYGGTGQNLSGSTGVLTISSGTVSASTTSAAIASLISDDTGSGSLVFGTTPTFTTSVVTSDATFSVFNTNATTINAFGAATTLSIGANSGTATFNSTNNTSGSSSGALVVSGGVGIGRSVSIGGYLNIFNGSNFAAFRYTGSGNTIYTLPTSSPSTGTSVLQSDATGIMSWVPMVASSTGAGSGTVATPGAQYQIAAYYWSAVGASVSGSSTFTNNIATNVVNISHNTAAISTGTGALTVAGGVGIGGSLYTATSVASNISGVVLSNGAMTASSVNKVTITAPATSATLTLADGSTLVTSGANSLTLTTTGPTSVTLPTSGTLVNSAVTSLGSLTSASSLNTVGTISSGTWSATAITALYGGTGFNSYAVGDLLVASTGTSLAKLAASSNTGYVLTSTGANSVPTWQAVPASAASSVAVIPTALNQSFFITAVSTSSGTGLGLSTITSLVINPSTGIVSLSGLAVTATTPTTSPTTGALTVTGGAGIANSAFIGGMLRVGNNTFTKSYSLGDIALDNGSTVDTPAVTHYWGNNINFGTDVYSDGVGSTRYRVVYNLNETGGREVFTVDVTGNVRLYNSGGGNYFGFRFSGNATTTYTLPTYTPVGTAVSVLSSDPTGVMTWIGIPAGGGSGSVNSGTVNYAAFYGATGNAVSENSNLQFTGTGLSVGGNFQSTSTTTGSLQVRGGFGITGNAFIGGTTTVTNSTASISITSGALTVAGGVGIGGSLFTATSVASSISGVILSNNTVNKVTITAPASSATLTLADGSTLATSGANSLTLTTTGPTSVTLPTSGTLVNSAVTSLGSLTSASSLNTIGTITSGTWAGTPITALYGGTGFNSYSVGDLLVASTGNSLARLTASSNTGYVLTSTGANSVPTWQAVPPAAATSVAVTPTALNQSFFITTVSASSGTGLGLSTITSFVVNPSSGLVSVSGLAVTSLAASGATNAGALTVVGGVGIGLSLYVGGSIYAGNGGSILNSPLYLNSIQIGGAGNNINFLDASGAVIGNFNTSNGWFRSAQTTESSSTGTGSLVTLGGLGVAKNAFIGGTASVTSTQTSITSNSGALVVSGGVGIGGSLYVAAASRFESTTASLSTGTGAVVISGGLGLAGNAFIGGTASVTSGQASVSSNSGALVVAGGAGVGGSLYVAAASRFESAAASGSTSTGAVVIAGGLGIAGNAFIGGTFTHYNNTSSFSTNSGSIVSTGGLGLAGNAFIGGTVNLTNSNSSISINSGALVVSGGVGIGGSLFTNANNQASISGVVLNNGSVTTGTWAATAVAPQYGGTGLNNSSATGLLQFSSGTASVITSSAALATIISDETGTAGKLVFSTSPTFTTSVITDSASFDVFNTTATTINAFGAATTISLGAASGTVTVNSGNNTLLPSSGALVVSGGVGIGKSASIAGSLLLFNGSNYSGLKYTGTAVTTYTLPPNSPQSSAGTSVLSSAIDGTMSWIGMSTGTGSATPGGSNFQVQYNNGSAFAGATGMTWNDSSNLLTLAATTTLTTSTQTALRIANQNNTDPSTNTRWSPGFEMVGLSGVTAGAAVTYNTRFLTEVVPQGPSNYNAYQRTRYSFDLRTASPSYNNDIFRIHSTFGVGIGASNSNSNAISYFRVNTSQTGDLTYVLPPTYPSTGTSVLQSDTSGNLLWVNMAGGSPGGSGTVNSGTAGSIALYPANGTAVSGTSLITAVGAGVTIGANLDASTTLAAALSVRGGIGVTGNAFIGGTTSITNTTASLNVSSGALVVAGGAAVGGTLNVGNMVKVGSLNYSTTNALGVFQSNVNSYNQLIIQNTNSGGSASADIVVSNDQSSDTAFYGNFGMNSSGFSGAGALAAPNAVYVTATSGPLVFGTTTQHPIRFTVNGGATDMLYFAESGTAISCFVNFGLRSASDLRFWNSGNTFYAGIQGGNTVASYLLTMPTATVGAGVSAVVTDSNGQMYFVAPGAGIAFSAGASNTPTIRAKRALTMQFAAGYTPLAAGPDNVILKIPQAVDGVSLSTFQLRELDIRVETASAGVSRIQLEKYTGTTAFTLGSGVGLSLLGGFGITLTGAGTYTTSTSFAAGVLTTSNDKLRLNWTLLNATHANFTIQLTMEEV